MSVRLRYAPSPTGDPHVGNIRQALWSWLHTRHYGGQFIIRLEDTDQTRAVPDSLERILDSLRWLGIDWDEGPDVGGPHAPYIQSQRIDMYKNATNILMDINKAYRCFCTTDELADLRKRQQTEHRPTGYEGKCRQISGDESRARAEAGEPHVVRFRMRDDQITTWIDELRGEISVENRLQEDFIILKTDGFPTYHLAHVVDDHEMEITHITRGEEWIPSAPRHVQLFKALGYDLPLFVHTPVVLGSDGGKLSKRHGAKFVLEYADEGYVPDALVNFLATTGWALDDHTEIISRNQLVKSFDVFDLSVSAGLFDTRKLEWMNGVYIREMPESELVDVFAERLNDDLPPDHPRPLDRNLVARITPLVRERIKLLSELAPLVDFFFMSNIAALPENELLGKKYKDRPEDAKNAISSVIATLQDPSPSLKVEELEDSIASTFEHRLRNLSEELGEKPGDLFMLCRLAITGKRVTPPLFETMEIVGLDVCIERLLIAKDSIS